MSSAVSCSSVRHSTSLNFLAAARIVLEKLDHAERVLKIMGEFGAFDHHEKTFAAAVNNLVQVRDLANNENVNGMLFWTYDCQEQERLYHATDDWELFYRKMGNFE